MRVVSLLVCMYYGPFAFPDFPVSSFLSEINMRGEKKGGERGPGSLGVASSPPSFSLFLFSYESVVIN